MIKIITFGNDLLTKKSEIITEITDEIKQLSIDMFKSMYFSNGIGLAAIQVGQLIRLITVDVPDQGKYTMINPEILERDEKTQIFEEGCLSLPGISNNVERSNRVSVKFLDIDGKEHAIEVKDLLATCVQHEIDHLNGILFIDRIPPEERITKIREYKKLHIV